MSKSEEDYISKTGEEFPWKNVRLPSFVSPEKYTLYIQPDLRLFKNTGTVTISFTVTSKTDFIVLHSKELILTQTKMFKGNKINVPLEKVLEYIKHEQLFIKVQDSLIPGITYVLCIDFWGKLEEKLSGFYLSSYTTSDGQTRFLASTHFEPTHARNAFPCFDEPAMKSTFQLTIVHSDKYKVYSNTEVNRSSSREEGLTVTEFEETVKMSTYLVAFVVCDFEELEYMSLDGIKIRVIAPAEQLPEAKFALTSASNILPFYETFFGIKYPLTKLDMIAIPDFDGGAMENWGLITYRMVTILFNPTETSCSMQENIAITIAHELAHQWFGNLVTMKWWNDLWLNEGFANFVEYLGVDHIHPEWNVMNQFNVDVTQGALALDALETSHPIMIDVINPYDIESIFDTISYTKGASLIHMLQDALGMDTLKEGLMYYLMKYRYNNAKTEDLWNAFTSVVKTKDVDIVKMMDTWTFQKGFPLVYASYNRGMVHVRQERFLLSPPDVNIKSVSKDVSPFDYKWYIPISYITDKDSNKNIYWFNTTEGEFHVPPRISWLKLNVNQSGFYRVMYEEKMWRVLIRQMQTDHTVFSPADRACLLDDALVLARVGILKSDLAMELTKYLENECDYTPWETVLFHFQYLSKMLHESSALRLFEKYVRKLLRNIVKFLGWKDEGAHLSKKLRAIVLGAAVRYNDVDTIRKTKKLFHKWMNGGESVSSNLRRVVYFSGIRNGGEKEWQFCWKQYQKTQVSSEKQLLLSSLSQTRNHWQLIQYLNCCLDRDKIRPQDVACTIAFTSQNPIGHLLTWRFVRMNWPHLISMFGHGFAMETIISYCTVNFNTRFDYEEVKSFFAKVETGAGARAVQQGLEKIRTNIQWKENAESRIIQWLQQNAEA